MGSLQYRDEYTRKYDQCAEHPVACVLLPEHELSADDRKYNARLLDKSHDRDLGGGIGVGDEEASVGNYKKDRKDPDPVVAYC